MINSRAVSDGIRTWMLKGLVNERADHVGPHAATVEKTHSWWRVMCLTGVDYFSTLGYQPAIAALAAGLLSPIATIVLVALTLLGALPVYRRVAQESFNGSGSIQMLDRLLPWWAGKLFVLVLLGFAATDFMITITLSAADATAHAIENPFAPSWMHGQEVLVTLFLVALLGLVFLRGFKEAIGIAVVLVAIYLLLNLVVILVSIGHVAGHAALITDWWAALTAQHGNPLVMVGIALIVFPKLALGLSGFETGVAVMPHVTGDASDTEKNPAGRIRDTKRLLTTAALIMSGFLITSSIVTTLLIPQKDFQPRRTGQRSCPRVSRTRIPRTGFRIHLRHQYHLHPVVCRRVGDGRSPQPCSPLPAAVRDGAPVGQGRPPARPGLHRHRIPDHRGLPGERRRPGRRVRHRSARADDVRLRRRDTLGLAQAAALAHPRVRRHHPDPDLHDGRQCL
ncbi:hypothetical protein IWX77_001348 [Cryobacterium sp. CAN_C2]